MDKQVVRNQIPHAGKEWIYELMVWSLNTSACSLLLHSLNTPADEPVYYNFLDRAMGSQGDNLKANIKLLHHDGNTPEGGGGFCGFFFLRINPKIMVTASLLSVQDYQLWNWTNWLVGNRMHKFHCDSQVNLEKEDTCWGMFPTLRNTGSEYVYHEVENWLLHTQHRF